MRLNVKIISPFLGGGGEGGGRTGNLSQKMLNVCDGVQEKECPEENLEFVERFLILTIDLEALLPTRR